MKTDLQIRELNFFVAVRDSIAGDEWRNHRRDGKPGIKGVCYERAAKNLRPLWSC